MRCGCSIRGPALRARLPPDLSTVNRSVRFRLPAEDRHVTRTRRAPGPRSPRRSPLERIASRYRWRSRPSASSTSGNGFNRSMQETSQQTSSWVWSMPERRMTCDTALPIPATHGRLQMSQFMARHEAQYSEPGAQGRSHVELLAWPRRLGEVRIVSGSGTSSERLFARLSEAADTLTPEDRSGSPPVLRAVRDAAEALDGAGLIVTATSSTRSVFDGRDLVPGAHVNAVGSYRPDMQKLDADVVRRARVVVDQREAAWAEAGISSPAEGRPDRQGHRRRRARRDRQTERRPADGGTTSSRSSSP